MEFVEAKQPEQTQNLPGLTEAEVRRLRGLMCQAWERVKDERGLTFRQASAEMGLSSPGAINMYLRGAHRLNLPFILKYRDYLNDTQFTSDITPYLNKMISGDRLVGSAVKVIGTTEGVFAAGQVMEFPGILPKSMYAVRGLNKFYLISGDRSHIMQGVSGQKPLMLVKKDYAAVPGKVEGDRFKVFGGATVAVPDDAKLYRIIAEIPA